MLGVAGRKLKKYSKGFKLSAVADVLVSQMGLRKTARKYGIKHKMIQTWIKIYLENGKSYFQDEIDDGSGPFPNSPATLSSVQSDGLAVNRQEESIPSGNNDANRFSYWIQSKADTAGDSKMCEYIHCTYCGTGQSSHRQYDLFNNFHSKHPISHDQLRT